MIGTTRIGGFKRHRGTAPEVESHPGLAAEQITHLNRLERDLQRACARYERAIAVLDEESTELERRARTEAIVDAAMKESAPAPGEEPIRLADATFADLREIGLSITQAKRVIVLRDEGVLVSTDDIDEVPGLPRVVALELQHRLQD